MNTQKVIEENIDANVLKKFRKSIMSGQDLELELQHIAFYQV